MFWCTIPEVPLLRIFFHLPMEDLLFRANLVCRRWNDLQRDACAQRRALVIVLDPNDARMPTLRHDPFAIPFVNDLLAEQSHANASSSSSSLLNVIGSSGLGGHYFEDNISSKWSRVQLIQLNGDKIDHLAVQLPNITSLTVIHDNTNTYDVCLFPLLDTWQHKLVTLKLFFPNTHYFSLEWNFVVRMFDAINSLPKLNSCTFLGETMPHNDEDDDDDDRLDLRFVSRLEEYCFSGLKHHHFGSLEQYASGNARLKRIGWHISSNYNGMMNTMPPEVLNSTDDAFAAKFTHLDLDKEFLRKVKLNRFANVTTVKLDIVNVNSDDLTISAYFRPLVQQLKQLIHLKVSLWVNDLARPDFVPPPPPDDDAVLSTVKVLTLKLVGSKDFHSDMSRCLSVILLHVAAIRVLSIVRDLPLHECTACAIGWQVRDHGRILNCVRDALRPLKQFRDSSLQRPLLRLETLISVQQSQLYRKWSVEEL